MRIEAEKVHFILDTRDLFSLYMSLLLMKGSLQGNIEKAKDTPGSVDLQEVENWNLLLEGCSRLDGILTAANKSLDDGEEGTIDFTTEDIGVILTVIKHQSDSLEAVETLRAEIYKDSTEPEDSMEVLLIEMREKERRNNMYTLFHSISVALGYSEPYSSSPEDNHHI
jgi:hypothetical protein